MKKLKIKLAIFFLFIANSFIVFAKEKIPAELTYEKPNFNVPNVDIIDIYSEEFYGIKNKIVFKNETEVFIPFEIFIYDKSSEKWKKCLGTYLFGKNMNYYDKENLSRQLKQEFLKGISISETKPLSIDLSAFVEKGYSYRYIAIHYGIDNDSIIDKNIEYTNKSKTLNISVSEYEESVFISKKILYESDGISITSYLYLTNNNVSYSRGAPTKYFLNCYILYNDKEFVTMSDNSKIYTKNTFSSIEELGTYCTDFLVGEFRKWETFSNDLKVANPVQLTDGLFYVFQGNSKGKKSLLCLS